jgi:hypothetical protein
LRDANMHISLNKKGKENFLYIFIFQALESCCASRIGVLKDMKLTLMEKERLKEHEARAKQLLRLFAEDSGTWAEERGRATANLATFKVDALLTAAFVCYAGVFDVELRAKLVSDWVASVAKLERLDGEVSRVAMSGVRPDAAGRKAATR